MVDYKQELKAIDDLTTRLYNSICFKPGERPPLHTLPSMFIPEGFMVNNDNSLPVIMTVGTFTEFYKEQIAEGSFQSFYETEINSKTDIFGKIAQRFSTYKAGFDINGQEPIAVGINSIQFIKIESVWKVTCMTWTNQTDEMPIPGEYL
jgi:hypothetical protein